MTTSNPSQAEARAAIGIALAIAVAAFVVFLPARHGEFLNWDDLSYVAENDHVKGGITWTGFVWAFTHSHSANWHPLTWLSHAFDCQIYGLQPGGHHMTNVLFHSLNSALLFLLLRLLTGALWRSALVAAIFALHPMRVESVAWVAERKDVLSTFFGLLTLMAYARFAQYKRQNAELNAGSTTHPALPPLDADRETIQQSEVGNQTDTSSRRRAPSPLPMRKQEIAAERATWIWYGVALVFYALGLMSKPMLVTWPFVMLLLDLWPLRRFELSTTHFGLLAFKRLVLEKLPFFGLALATGTVTMLAQKQAGAVASFAQLPLGSRLQNAAVAYTEYLAKLFWPVNLSPVYPHPAQWAVWQVVGAVALLVGLGVAVWFGRRRFPCGITGAFWFVGTLVPVIGIMQVGSQAFADRYTYVPHIGLLWMLVWLTAEVVRRLRLPKRITGILAATLLAILSWRTTEQLSVWKNTETLFRRTLELSPDNAQALNGLGGYYIKVGRMAEGRRLLEKLIRLQPTFVEARVASADALDGEGHYADAVKQYEMALAIQPDNADLLNNLAWLRAACPDAALRNGAESVDLATRACALTGHAKPLFIGTLAAAEAEAGDFPAAIATAERAASLAQALRLNETAVRNRELIELYREGKAAHGGRPKTP